MKTITVILEKGKDGYGVSFEDIPNVYGFGETVEDAKKDAKDVLDFFVSTSKQFNKSIPEVLAGKYKMDFKFDISTILDYVSGTVTQSALAKATGINVAQISHYATRRAKPRESQRKKIINGLHQIAKELLTVS